MGDTFYRFAVICKEFKYSLDQIGDMTDAQINKILFHARKERTGEIERPVKKEEKPRPTFSLNLPETTPAEDHRKERFAEYFDSYNALFNAFQNKHISKDNFDECVVKLRAKFADLWVEKSRAEKSRAEEPQQDASVAESLATLERCRLAGLLTEAEFEAAKIKLQKISAR